MNIYLPYIKNLELDEGKSYKIGYILDEKAYILTRYKGTLLDYIFYKNEELYSEYEESKPYDDFLLSATEDQKKELKIQLLLELGETKITNNLIFVKKVIPSYVKYNNIYLWITHKIILIPSIVETYIDLSKITTTITKYTKPIEVDLLVEDTFYSKLYDYSENKFKEEQDKNILNNVEHLRRYLDNNDQLEDNIDENTPIESIRLLGQRDIFLRSILEYPILLEEYMKWSKISGNLEDYCGIPEESIKLLKHLPYVSLTKDESCLRTIKILNIDIGDNDFISAIKNKWNISNLKELSSNLNISDIFRTYLSEDKISLDIIDIFYKLGLVISEDMVDMIKNKRNRISILNKFKEHGYDFSWQEILDLAKENDNDNLVFIGKILENRSKEEIKSKIKEILESDNHSKGAMALNLSKLGLEKDLDIAKMFLNSDAYPYYIVEYIKAYPKNYFLKSIINSEIEDNTDNKNLEIITKMDMDITEEDLKLATENSLDDKYILYMKEKLKR